MAVLFAALADRTRLWLLNRRDGKEVCVCYFVETLSRANLRFHAILPTCAAPALSLLAGRASGCTTKSLPRSTRAQRASWANHLPFSGKIKRLQVLRNR